MYAEESDSYTRLVHLFPFFPRSARFLKENVLNILTLALPTYALFALVLYPTHADAQVIKLVKDCTPTNTAGKTPLQITQEYVNCLDEKLAHINVICRNISGRDAIPVVQVLDANLIVKSDNIGEGNLIVGRGHVTSKAIQSFVTGRDNTVEGAWNSAIGGTMNQIAREAQSQPADIFGATICGGRINRATSRTDSIIGGADNGDGSSNNERTYTSFIGGNANTQGFGTITGSTVVGGDTNTNAASVSTVIGGRRNQIQTPQESTSAYPYSAICGGEDNTMQGSVSVIIGGRSNLNVEGNFSSISGGSGNRPLKNSYFAVANGGQYNSVGNAGTVNGGISNYVEYSASVVGGIRNIANGSFSVIVGGGVYNPTRPTANTAAVIYSSILGGSRNTAGVTSSQEQLDLSPVGGTIVGGSQNIADGMSSMVCGGFKNHAMGVFSSVGGGRNNTATKEWSVVVGGRENQATGFKSTVIGGRKNIAEALSSTVVGGRENHTRGQHSLLMGGRENETNFSPNYQAPNPKPVYTGKHAVVAGGHANRAVGDHSTILGGDNNKASGDKTTVCGGSYNEAGGNASVVLGGHRNQAIENYGLICGGYQNKLSGNRSNVIRGGKNKSITSGSFQIQ